GGACEPFATVENVLSYTDIDAVPGVSYSYQVFAFGEDEPYNGAPSAVKTITAACVQPKKPAAALDPETGKPVITWEAVKDATGYGVYRSTSTSSKKFKPVEGAEIVYTDTGVSFTDTTAKKGTTYYYKVVALSGASASAQSSYVKIKSK
ncbi:MAG: hypothetical protein IJB02_04200, partial [Oscillospiraceae bacterium]|nr:hypothetical protein [Oscillospiraceae bacterium]